MNYAHSESSPVETFYEQLHNRAFPRMTHTSKATDVSTQLSGVDRTIHFPTTSIAVEEKLDGYGDRMNIAFELHQSPYNDGWAYKPQASDVMLYAWWHQRIGYYFNTRALITWFRENTEALRSHGFKLRYTQNGACIQPIPALLVAQHVSPYAVISL